MYTYLVKRKKQWKFLIYYADFRNKWRKKMKIFLNNINKYTKTAEDMRSNRERKSLLIRIMSSSYVFTYLHSSSHYVHITALHLKFKKIVYMDYYSTQSTTLRCLIVWWWKNWRKINDRINRKLECNARELNKNWLDPNATTHRQRDGLNFFNQKFLMQLK